MSDEELARAKNMLKSLMMMQLESRMVLCEDIARQYITYGYRVQPKDLCHEIENVTKKDLLSVAMKMILTKPSIGIVGPESSLADKVPSYDEIKNFADYFRNDIFRKHKITSENIAALTNNNSK